MKPCLFSISYAGLWDQAALDPQGPWQRFVSAVREMCSPLRGGGSLENLDACATTYLKWMKAHQLL